MFLSAFFNRFVLISSFIYLYQLWFGQDITLYSYIELSTVGGFLGFLFFLNTVLNLQCPLKGFRHITSVSLNVKGINIPEKRSIALSFAKRQKAHVVFCQQTQFKGTNHRRLHNQFFPLAFHSTDPRSKRKGVSILLAKSFPFLNNNSIIDPDRRYVFLTGTLGTKKITVANIYLPNVAQVEGLVGVMDELKSFAMGSVILGGPMVGYIDGSFITFL